MNHLRERRKKTFPPSAHLTCTSADVFFFHPIRFPPDVPFSSSRFSSLFSPPRPIAIWMETVCFFLSMQNRCASRAHDLFIFFPPLETKPICFVFARRHFSFQGSNRHFCHKGASLHPSSSGFFLYSESTKHKRPDLNKGKGDDNMTYNSDLKWHTETHMHTEVHAVTVLSLWYVISHGVTFN